MTDEDDCFFVGEYFAYAGYKAGRVNSMISNLKKGIELKAEPQYYWKGVAIKQAANDLRAVLEPADLTGATVVPVPPSEAYDDPMHDDRMVQVARLLCDGRGANVREILYQEETRPKSHLSNDKRDVEKLMRYLCIDEAACSPTPTFIFVLDDVLTTGASFRACKLVLQQRFGTAIPIVGLFVARRIPRKDEPPDWVDPF